jgi:hypothetical protein
MNGATAEPLLSTTRPPNTTIINRTGSSQNFLRTRIKRHNSSRKSNTKFPSELIFHRLGLRSRGLPSDPVAAAFGLSLEPEQVFPKRPHY